MQITMVITATAECSTLTFANCNNCSDMDVATGKAECYSCDPGYALQDDNSTCRSMFSAINYFYCVILHKLCVSINLICASLNTKLYNHSQCLKCRWTVMNGVQALIFKSGRRPATSWVNAAWRGGEGRRQDPCANFFRG